VPNRVVTSLLRIETTFLMVIKATHKQFDKLNRICSEGHLFYFKGNGNEKDTKSNIKLETQKDSWFPCQNGNKKWTSRFEQTQSKG